MILTIPIPSSELATNKTSGWHYGKHSAMRKKAREDGYYLALEDYNKNKEVYDMLYYTPNAIKGEWRLLIKVFHKNEKHCDDDNLEASTKNFRDGVFDFLKQKFGMNDRQITLTTRDTSGRDKLNPRIEWELKPRI